MPADHHEAKRSRHRASNQADLTEILHEVYVPESVALPASPAPVDFSQVLLEDDVHEGVDEGVGYVVSEVEVEDHELRGHDAMGHQPGG